MSKADMIRQIFLCIQLKKLFPPTFTAHNIAAYNIFPIVNELMSQYNKRNLFSIEVN